jgi:hypothetical protein
MVVVVVVVVVAMHAPQVAGHWPGTSNNTTS